MRRYTVPKPKSKRPAFGYMEESATTRLNGTNIFGNSYKELGKYFGNPDKDGFLYFRDMTPNQVSRWNAEQANTYGMHIDPNTRTAEQYVFVTGKKPVISTPWNLGVGTTTGAETSKY